MDIIKTKIWEPYQIAEFFGKSNKKFKAGQFDVGENQSWKSKLSIWVRGNFFIPDARVFWVKPSIEFLTKYLKENQFDAFVTTGPPHSLHLIGFGLKTKFPNLKWIADFRDPWTEISYYKHLKLSKSSDRKHRDLEEKVFKTADVTLATSYTDAENFRKKGANAVCITNGFDIVQESESREVRKSNENSYSEKLKHSNTQTLEHSNTQDKFVLSYIGVLEQLRNPEILWKVLDDLINENPEFRKDFELKFVGRIDDKISEKIERLELKNAVRNLGYLSHQEANTEMNDSNILLITNFPDENSKGIIPGKIFEYLATGKQMISFGPKESDVKRILDETASGKHFSYDDYEAVKKFIVEKFNEWKRGEVSSSVTNIEQFSRKNLTKKLVEVLERG